MPVLTIASSKGGPGKTTLRQALAAALVGELRLVVLGADPTQAVSRWAANAYEGVAFETHAEADETKLAHPRHAAAELKNAGVERLHASLSDLVAFSSLSYSGKLSGAGASAEVAALIEELRGLGWLPSGTPSRNDATA